MNQQVMTSGEEKGEPVIDVSGLSVDIAVPAGTLRAVSDVSFKVHPAETLSRGRIGMRQDDHVAGDDATVARAAKLTARHIRFDGEDITHYTEKEMSRLRGNRMGMIFQDPMTSLNPVYRIGDQLEEVYMRHRNASRKEARERAHYLLEKVGIINPTQRLTQFPHQLSGGLRQRMMIAMMLMCEPKLVIADEPTTALDVTVQVQILQLLRSLQQEFRMALVLITHNLGVVARMADHVAVMYAGKVVEQGAVADVFDRPTHPYTRGLLDCIPRHGLTAANDKLGSIPGIVPSLVGKITGCSFRNRCNYRHEPCAFEDIKFRDASAVHQYRCLLPPDHLAAYKNQGAAAE